MRDKNFFKKIGSLGGESNIAKNGLKHMAKIGKMGALKRWGKVDK